MQRASWILGAVAGLLPVAVIAACSSSSTGGGGTPNGADGGDAAADAPVPVDAGSCLLTPAMSTGNAACDDCRQSFCCQVFFDCLGETVCNDLNTCITQCNADAGVGTDAGTECIQNCAHGVDDADHRLSTALGCESTSCATQCQ